MSVLILAAGSASHSGQMPLPTPVHRAPLPPFQGPEPPDNLPVNTTPPGNLIIPPRPNLRFHRGNLCGLRVAGLPAVPGGAADPSLFLSWFLDRYSVADQERILTLYGQAGYSHLYLSWPDSRAFGQSPAQFLETCQRAKQRGYYVGVFWGSKDYDPANDTVDGWPSEAFPVLESLVAANAIDFAIPGWEWPIWNVPGDTTYQIFKTFRSVAPTVLWYYHGTVGNISWQQDGTNTATFYNTLMGTLTGCLYQADVDWSAGMLQARINDVTDRFAGNFGFSPDSGFGHPWDCVAFEISATAQFNGNMTEDFGDLRGLEALYSIGPIPVQGCGNGVRQPDGHAL